MLRTCNLAQIALAFGVLLTSSCSSPTPSISTISSTSTVAANTQDTTPQPPAEPKAKEIAQALLGALQAKDYANARKDFSPEVDQGLSNEKLAAVWESMQKQLGEIQRVGDLSTETISGNLRVTIPLYFKDVVLDMRVVVSSEEKVVGLFFAPSKQTVTPYTSPSYAKANAFTTQNVVIGTAPWQLPGTLTLPKDVQKPPVVLLLHGSGPHDRDESVMSQKPFRDLAEGLASLGIATLRYDKRTFVFPDKIDTSITIQEEVIDDAQAAIAWLQKSDLVDTSKIYVLGHSLGGMLLPRVAKAQTLAGLIFMAAPALPLEDKILQQYQYLFSLDGSVSTEEQAALDKLNQQLEALRSSKLSKDTSASDLPLGLSGAYWLSIRGLQAAEEAKSLSVPMLFLQGDRDYQVTESVDFTRWKKMLGEGENTTYKLYSGANHLFIKGSGPASPKDYETPGHVEEQVVRDIAAWIKP